MWRGGYDVVEQLTQPLDLGGSFVNLVIAALAASFALLGFKLLNPFEVSKPFTLGVLAGALIGFITHEIMHEKEARKFGCWASFKLHPLGLLVTLLSGLMPIALIMPGAVMVMCRGFLPRWGEARIASSGVKANIAIAYACILAQLLVGHPWLNMMLRGVAGINSWIAFFNLLPIPPLDGSKLLTRAPIQWVMLFILAGIACALSF